MNDRVMQLPAMLELLERLVNIDSGSMNVAGVNKVSGILTAAYQEIGFVPTVCFHPAYGNTVILRHKEAHYPGLLLTVHTDTVFPDGTAKKRPFVSRGDYAYGPGVFDMKASQVMLLSAMKSLALENSQTLREIEIIINPDEEIGSISSREIIELRSSGKKKGCTDYGARGRRGAAFFFIREWAADAIKSGYLAGRHTRGWSRKRGLTRSRIWR
ncbi:M20/M25/M40 family metallo-hydrolase [Terrilactibacillus sp. S3-3]|nr:M20/M25/M40 family metallo-hydrolase [Terrilactibacillus sp. S3-3]